MSPKPGKKGFTLVEMIVSLVLIGILTVMAGLGLSQIARGYSHARMNTRTAEKGQLAMARIVKELGSIRSVSTGSSKSLHYTRTDGVDHTLALSGGRLTISSGSQIDPLIDNVSVFGLTYQESLSGRTADVYTAGSSRIVNVTLGIGGAEGYVSTFKNRVYLRAYNR